MIKLLLVIALASLLAGGGSPANAQNTLQLPVAVKSLLDQALAEAQVQFQPVNFHGIDQAGTKFQALMDQIGSQVSPELARKMAARDGNDIYAKLITIAWDRHTRPEVYQEIEQHYLHTPFRPGQHVQHSADLNSRHVTEAYRLPWEFYQRRLLRPSPPLVGVPAYGYGFSLWPSSFSLPCVYGCGMTGSRQWFLAR